MISPECTRRKVSGGKREPRYAGQDTMRRPLWAKLRDDIFTTIGILMLYVVLRRCLGF